MDVVQFLHGGDTRLDNGREADEVKSKDEKRLNLGGRESHFLRRGGAGCRTAGCVLARKRDGAGVIDGDALAARLAGFLVRLLGSSATMAAPTRIGPSADGRFTRGR